MISISCTKCDALLTMDDAFAGGVCRCQYCGTIQTVPSHLKEPDGAAAPKPATVKTLYQNQARGGSAGSGQSSGLDELAQAISGSGSGLAGSGLGSGRLRAPPQRAAPAPPTEARPAQEQPHRRSLVLPLAIGIGLLLIAAIAVGIFIFSPRANTSEQKGPSFAGVTLNGNSVVYLLDNGNSNETLFDPLKAACFRSLASLGPERKFQVALWDNNVNAAAYPPDGLRAATPQEIAACKTALADTVATGNSHLVGPLKRAIALHPAIIIIATAKWDLDHDDREALAEAQGAGVKLYTFGLGTAPESGDLKLAASASGGQFKHLSRADLDQAAD